MKKNGRIRTGLKVALLSALMVLVMIPMLAYADDGDPGQSVEKSVVTLDFGQKHTALAEQAAVLLEEGSESGGIYDAFGKLDCEVSGSVVTILITKDWRSENDVLVFLDNFMNDITSPSGMDQGEALFYGYKRVGKKTNDKYKSQKEIEIEWAETMGYLGDSLTLHVLWIKPVTEASFTVEPLKCGSVINVRPGSGMVQYPKQDPVPVVTSDPGSQLVTSEESLDLDLTIPPHWFTVEPASEDELMDSKNWAEGQVEEKDYVAGFLAVTRYGYYVDVANPPVVKINGKVAGSIMFVDGSGGLVYAPVKAVSETKPDNRENQKGSDGTALGKGASAEAAEKAILAMKKDADPAGSKFAILQLKSTKQTKKSVKVTWKKASGAKKYVIYGNACGTKNKMKKLATVTGTSKNFTKIAGKKVKKGTYYKFLVVAIDNNNKVVSSSKLIHVATTGGKVGNHKKVVVKAKVGKKTKTVSKVTVKKGKTLKLKTTLVPKSKKLKVKKHVKARYESSNTKIATVGGNGKIKAKAKGTCYVFAYAQNGVSKKIKVTVK